MPIPKRSKCVSPAPGRRRPFGTRALLPALLSLLAVLAATSRHNNLPGGIHTHKDGCRFTSHPGIGLDLTGSILDIADRTATPDPGDDGGPARTLDSGRGRTFLLNATMKS